MFTGIIECIGEVTAIEEKNGSRIFTIKSSLASSLKIDQSVAHNGVCLTVTHVSEDTHTVCAIEETLSKTNLSDWTAGQWVNLERCMLMNGRLDGHLVQGHVDAVARCIAHMPEATQHRYVFQIDEKFAPLIIEKGSVCVNGISLTCYQVRQDTFEVAIIPYTFEHTTMHTIEAGSVVNIEFDVIGKYVLRQAQLR